MCPPTYRIHPDAWCAPNGRGLLKANEVRVYVVRGRSSNRKGPREALLAQDRPLNEERAAGLRLKIAQAGRSIRTVVQGFARRCSVCETPVPRAFPV
ncbi:hypothetical protein GCM10011428_82030 [Streptomyces violaceus]